MNETAKPHRTGDPADAGSGEAQTTGTILDKPTGSLTYTVQSGANAFPAFMMKWLYSFDKEPPTGR